MKICNAMVQTAAMIISMARTLREDDAVERRVLLTYGIIFTKVSRRSTGIYACTCLVTGLVVDGRLVVAVFHGIDAF